MSGCSEALKLTTWNPTFGEGAPRSRSACSRTSPKWLRIQSRAKEWGTPNWNTPSLIPRGRTCLNQVRNSVSEIWSRT